MTPTAIKIAFLKKGITQRSIADELSVSSVSVNRVIAGLSTSRRIAHAISEAIGKPFEKVFPNYPKPKVLKSNARLIH